MSAAECFLKCPCHEPEWCAIDPSVGCDVCAAFHGRLADLPSELVHWADRLMLWGADLNKNDLAELQALLRRAAADLPVQGEPQ